VGRRFESCRGRQDAENRSTVFSPAYPQKWGLRSADTNIDHRRVPNLMRYFEREGKARRDFSVVHNIGYGALDEDVLRTFPIIGHYCW
jgi:uncharacterized protein YijF (DUF1287 family)